jgi:anti-sigma regulatory factor (Ser/Thr protein kinase)
VRQAVSERAGNEHCVKFHESDRELVTTAARFLGDALAAGGRAVVIATPEHRRQIEEELFAPGHSSSPVSDPMRYVGLDAASLLEAICVGPRMDPRRFDMTVSRAIEKASDSYSATEARSLFFPVESAARKLRYFVDDVLDRWNSRFIADEASIIASELASNAIRHARSPFEVGLVQYFGNLRIEVSDGSRVQPSFVGGRSGRSGSGRGLAMVDALVDRWGVEQRSDGKNVWAEIGTQQR